jgi:hypothetical protein
MTPRICSDLSKTRAYHKNHNNLRSILSNARLLRLVMVKIFYIEKHLFKTSLSPVIIFISLAKEIYFLTR